MSPAVVRPIAVTALACAALACSVKADPSGTSFLCGANDRCPSGMRCIDGRCTSGDEDASPPPPDAPPGAIPLSLITPASGEALSPYTGQPINLNSFDFEYGGFTIRAEPEQAEAVVEFQTDGGWTFESTQQPHYLAGTDESETPMTFPYSLGEDRLVVTARVEEEVVSLAEVPLVVELDDVVPAVVAFEIVSSATGVATPIEDGGTVVLGNLPASYNIQVRCLPSVVRELRVSMDPPPSSWTAAEQSAGEREIEYAPYFVVGESQEDSLSLPVGAVELMATPVDVDGEDATPWSISFTVSDT